MSASRTRRAARGAAVLGTVTAVACAPPVAAPLFAIDELFTADLVAMWIWSTGLLALSWLVVDRAGASRAWIVAAFVSVLALVGAELAARAWLNLFAPWPRKKLAQFAAMTYGDQGAYVGHPFLQFIGRPGAGLRGGAALSDTAPFNELGFHGPSFPAPKPPGTVRIVCLGGSTTAGGFPARMQAWLEAQPTGGRRFECLNLAHGFYTSAHSLVNFVLNAVDFDPDYVVFHHGWNDARCGINAAEFRGDYFHALKSFDPPPIPDALLIRASTIYRLIKIKLLDVPDWAMLDAATFRPQDPALGHDLEAPLRTFARNAGTVVDVARARGITPIFVTVPWSTDPGMRFAGTRPRMERFAAELRRAAADRGVALVDLAREMSGRNELFKDVGHMYAAGIELKARTIGARILDDLGIR